MNDQLTRKFIREAITEPGLVNAIRNFHSYNNKIVIRLTNFVPVSSYISMV